MQDLVELVKLIAKTKFKSGDLLALIIDPGSRMARLYEAIAREEVRTDDDVKALFPDWTNDAVIKSKLKDRLHDVVLLLDFKEANYADRQKAFVECSKKATVGAILVNKNARISGIDLLENTLRHCIRFEFTELTLDILRTLRLHYAMIAGDRKRFLALEEQLVRYEQVWLWERKAESLYLDLIVGYVNSKSGTEAIAGQARRAFEQLEPLMRQSESMKLHLFSRLIELTIYESTKDYVRTADRCEDAIRFFEQKKYSSGLALQIFYYNLTVASLQLRQFERCEALFDRYENLIVPGSFNWYKLKELYFLLAMHSGHYAHAHGTAREVLQHVYFDEQPAHIRELWHIFEAYLSYVYQLSLFAVPEGTEPPSRLRPARFSSDVEVFSRDKRGMNIPVVIIQYLALLADKRHDALIDRAETMSRYIRRYLDDEHTRRSRCFMRMLLQIPPAGFQRAEVERKTTDLLAELNATPLEIANQSHEVEIIPYEVLWSIILKSL